MVEVSILQIEIPVRKAEFSSTSLEKNMRFTLLAVDSFRQGF